MIRQFIILGFYAVGILLLSTSCSPAVYYSQVNSAPTKNARAGKTADGQVIEGTASYYAQKFHGRKTASGEIYDMNKLTAAHRDLPFGTWIDVKNLENGKSVRVRVNDRGPFMADRILDLSLQAAKELDMIRKGTASVQIIILTENNNNL